MYLLVVNQHLHDRMVLHMLCQAEFSCSWWHQTSLVDHNLSLSFSAGLSVFLGQTASGPNPFFPGTVAQLHAIIIDFTLWSKVCCWFQVLDVAHWASLPPGKQAELYGRRALVSRAANQPVASFADWLHAAKVLLLLYYAVCE